MIYHVTTNAEWEAYKDQQVFAPTAFKHEGFIHTCHSHQLPGVLDRYYKANTDIILLHIDDRKLTSPLKHEPGMNGELFPHIYGVINKDAIEKIDLNRKDFLR